MFYTDEAVNQLLNYSKVLVDEINQSKDCPRELKEIQYLVFAGMVSYYGFSSIEQIYKAFEKTSFQYTFRTLQDVFANHPGLSSEERMSLENYNVPACLYTSVQKDPLSRFHVRRNIFISGSMSYPFDSVLEQCLHEVNHVMNSILYPVCKRKDALFLRLGLSLQNISTREINSLTLEESFNTLQTAEIMQHILSFSEYEIEDLDMKKIILPLASAERKNRQPLGYDNCVPLVRPLYDHPSFSPLIREARLHGDIKAIRDHFDQKIGDGSYMELSNALDCVFAEVHTYVSPAKSKVKSLVSHYTAS